MKRAMSLAAAVSIVIAGVVSAQTPPNFAGKWTLVPDPAGPAPGSMGAPSPSLTIVQDEKTLTVTRTTQIGEFTNIYNLDGSESKNTLNIQGTPVDQLSKTKWDGGKLVVNTTMSFENTPVEFSMVISQDAAGTLGLETTRPDFQGGGAPITTKSTYKKN
jgi:hypothetical protein